MHLITPLHLDVRRFRYVVFKLAIRDHENHPADPLRRA